MKITNKARSAGKTTEFNKEMEERGLIYHNRIPIKQGWITMTHSKEDKCNFCDSIEPREGWSIYNPSNFPATMEKIES